MRKCGKDSPGITLRTTMISGFPGETDAQHKELLNFVSDFGFDCLGVFEYSPEPGTPAGRLWQTDGIDAALAAQRKEEIMLAQQKVVFKKNKAMIGKTIKVLIDETNPKKKTATARHPGQAPDIDGRVLLSKCAAVPGEVVEVQIEDWNYYDLIGKPTGPVTTHRNPAETRRGPISLPVVGVVETSVEVRSKRG